MMPKNFRKMCVFMILLILSSTNVFSKMTLVIDIEDLLISKADKNKSSSYWKSTSSRDKFSYWGGRYFLKENAKSLASLLRKSIITNKMDVVLYSNLKKGVVQKAVRELGFSSRTRILGVKDLVKVKIARRKKAYFFDLGKVTPNLSNVIFLTVNNKLVQASQKKYVFQPIQKTFYKKYERDFSGTSDDYLRYRNVLYRLYNMLYEAAEDGSASGVRRRFYKYSREDKYLHEDIGKKRTQGLYEKYSYYWKQDSSKKKVIGCYQFNYRNKKYSKRQVSECKKANQTTFRFLGDAKKKINGCGLYTESTNKIYKDKKVRTLFIEKETNMSRCADSTSLSALWNIKRGKVVDCRLMDPDTKLWKEVVSNNKCYENNSFSTRWKLKKGTEELQEIIGCANFDDETKTLIEESKDYSRCESNSSFNFYWKLSNDKKKVLACYKVDYQTNGFFALKKTDLCKKDLGVRIEWKINKRAKKVERCQMVARNNSSSVIEEIEFKRCEKESGVSFKWDIQSNTLKSCRKVTMYGDYLIEKSSDVNKCLRMGFKGDHFSFAWKVVRGAVKGCDAYYGYQTESNKLKNKVSLSLCEESLGIKYKLGKNPAKNRIDKCHIMTSDGEGYIRAMALSECLKVGKISVRSSLKLNHSSEKVVGCKLIDPKTKLPLDVSLGGDECLNGHWFDYAWTVNKWKQNTGCKRVDPISGYFFKKADLKECLEVFETQAYWSVKSLDPLVKECQLFDRDLNYIDKSISNDQCSDEFYNFYDYTQKRRVGFNLTNEIEDALEDYTKLSDFGKYIRYKESVDYKKALISFKKGMKPFIKKLTRPVSVYNYRSRDLVKSKSGKSLKSRQKAPMRSHFGVDYAREWMAAFWKFNPSESGMLGWGLYAAMDNVSSRGYGDTVVSVEIPKNRLYLDIRMFNRRGGDSFPMSAETRELLNTICGYNYSEGKGSYKGVEYFLNNKKSMTSNILCQQLFTQAFKELDISAISYWWNGYDDNGTSGYRSFCNHSQKKGTFVLIDTPLNKNTVKVFVKEGPSQRNSDTELWYSRINYVYRYISSSQGNYYFSEVSNEIEKEFGLTRDLSKWAKSSLFSCDKRYKEDSY